jgi:hypothetical protein
LPGKWRIGALTAMPMMKGTAMEELIRTNDPVIISFAESLLKEAEIGYFIADQNMSIAEGSIGVLAKRILVDSDQAIAARRLMIDAGIGQELREQR